MQMLQLGAKVPPHPNIVELAALLEDDRLKAVQRQSLQRALRDVLRHPPSAQRLYPSREPTMMTV